MANHRSELVLARLSPQARQRFCACVAGNGVPRALWSRVAPTSESWKFLLPIGAVALLVMFLVGGDALLDWPWIAGWFVPVVLLAAGALGWQRQRKNNALLGFPAGTYLFASDLIEAHEGVCTLYDLDRLTEIRPKVVHQMTSGAPESELDFVFDHHILTVRLVGKQAAVATMDKFWAARETLMAALSAQEWDQVAALDPLYEARYMAGWDQMRQPVPIIAKHTTIDENTRPGAFLGLPSAVVGLACIIALVIAPALWWVGNATRDAMAFSRAKSHNTVAAWNAYMKRDQPRHYTEVRQHHLPQAAYRVAKKDGGAPALREFLAKYGSSEFAPEARQALHDIYGQAQEKIKADAGADARDAMNNLLRWMEEHGSNQLEVRFGSSSAAQMSAIDEFIQMLSDERRTRVPIAPVSPSLAAAIVTRHEDELVEKIKAGFATVLPSDVVQITKGGVFSGLVAALDQPALTVTCFAEPSPLLIPDLETRSVFLGLAFNVEFNLYVPGSKPHTSTFQVTFTDKVPKTRGKDNYYDGMLTYAFEETGARIADSLFPKYHPERRMALMELTPLVPDNSNRRYTATGFCVSPDGYIVTARHFTTDAKTFKVITKDGKIDAQLVMADPDNDLAVLKAATTFPAVLPVRPSDSVKLGESIATIGFPQTQLQGREPKIGKGEIASLSGMRDDPTMFQVSVPVQPGNSGGPLLDLHGNVVGVVVSILRQSQAVNYAVKSTHLMKLCERIPAIGGLATPNEGKIPAFEQMIEIVRPATVLIEGYP